MGYWNYGIVETGDKTLVICEVYYDDKNQPYGYSYVEEKEMNPVVIEDIIQQLVTYRIFKNKDFNKGRKRLVKNTRGLKNGI